MDSRITFVGGKFFIGNLPFKTQQEAEDYLIYQEKQIDVQLPQNIESEALEHQKECGLSQEEIQKLIYTDSVEVEIGREIK